MEGTGTTSRTGRDGDGGRTGSPPSDPLDAEAPGTIAVDEREPHVLRITGAADALTVEQTCAREGLDPIALGRALAAAGVTEIDLSEATFIDSSVLALVVSLMPALRPAHLRVRGATGSVLTVLTVTGLDALVELC
ncbi:STAS domain-containing protein [Cellulomonas sp. DKR-3]|uniref:STAS domain-containing protein n=1 Tax=Cellulomonas fulva TaxID=2835530 RepID=A0ABS5TWW3_9CELL|nr:STAS domain-containing protein [Cellulomonas fulva]MBT0993645.1 STAS domain-containing protein [Cellulomonas fulva]